MATKTNTGKIQLKVNQPGLLTMGHRYRTASESTTVAQVTITITTVTHNR